MFNLWTLDQEYSNINKGYANASSSTISEVVDFNGNWKSEPFLRHDNCLGNESCKYALCRSDILFQKLSSTSYPLPGQALSAPGT